jgi:hypothetical protein
MNHSLQLNHNYINELQHKLTYKYYQFRINTISDPYQIQLRITPYRILFILSHMRSGSSLLTHILNSNPEIIGYGETHLNYASEANIKDLIFKVYWRFKDLNMNHQYVLDKILHNHKILDDNLLKSQKISVIFLLREPQKTLGSILTIKPHLNEEEALKYYCERLKKIEEYAKLINNPQRTLLIQYHQLINQTSSVFAALQDFLATKAGFSEKYQVLKTTGVRGIGDSSENIKSGQIIKQKKELNINLSSHIIKQGEQVFDNCCESLNLYCSHI